MKILNQTWEQLNNKPSSKYFKRLDDNETDKKVTRKPISIFKNEELLRRLYPAHYPKTGPLVSKENSFSNAVVQGLNELKGITKNYGQFTVASLRKDCKDCVSKNANPDSWVYEQIMKDATKGGYSISVESVKNGVISRGLAACKLPLKSKNS